MSNSIIPDVDKDCPLYDAAAEFVAAGRTVIPLVRQDKKAYVKWCEEVRQETTLDEIEEWRQRYPSANLGMVTGRRSDVVVVEFDFRHGGSLEALEALVGPLPPTPTVRSGGGGIHRYFQGGDEIPTRTNAPITGVDVRGKGGLIVVPPSRHKSGNQYVFEVNVPLVPMPEKLRALVRGELQLPASVASAESWLKKALKRIEDGEPRNDTGLWFMFQLRDTARLSEEEAKPYALRFQRAVVHLGNHEYTEGEALNSLKSTYSQSARESAHKPKASQIGTLEMPTTFDGDALWTEEIPETRWAIPGILPEGCSLLAGRPKAGKSYLALGLGLAVAAGGKALGAIECEQARFLYLALEDNKRRLQARMKQLLVNKPSRPLKFSYAFDWPRLNEGGIDRLSEFLDAYPDTRLIVVDTLARVKPLSRSSNSYSYTEDYAAVSELTKLANDRHVAILVIHHTRKTQSDTSPIDDVSGTSGLTGAADAALVLRKLSGSLEAELHIDSRDLEEPCLMLKRDEHTSGWVLTGEKREELRLSAKQKAVVAFLRGRETATAADIWQALREPGDADAVPQAFYQTLKRMVAAGVLLRPAYGIYSLPPQSPHGEAPNLCQSSTTNQTCTRSTTRTTPVRFDRAGLGAYNSEDVETQENSDFMQEFDELYGFDTLDDEILRGADEAHERENEADACPF